MHLNETYNKVCVGKILSGTFYIQKGLQQGHALAPLLFEFSLECVIRKSQRKQTGTN
jgi:hypothetical protein